MEDKKDIQIQIKKIPAFTVIKNGSILKNIFLLRKQSNINKSSQNQESDEEILIVGRHPQCHITLEHPSISRYHLRIRSNPCLQSLSVEDLSSVHGTWVSGKRIEPGVHVVLKEGDTVKLGGSSRVYELHWVPRSQAYDVDEQLMPAVYTIKEGGEDEETNQDEKHEEYSSNDDLECLDLSTSNTIHDSPLKTLNLLTSGNERDIFATVTIQASLVVPETTSATQISDSLNDPEDYSLVDDLECSDLSSLNMIHDSPVKTLSPLTTGDENEDNFAPVSIQAPLVSETTSTKQVSDSLNNSDDHLMANSSKSSSDDTEVEQSSTSKHEEYSLVDDLECSDLSTSNKIHDSPLKKLNPLTFADNDDIFATVSIQDPLVSVTTPATHISDSLNDPEDQLMPNCSISSCDDTEVDQSSPLKTGNESGEPFTTVCVQAPLVTSEAISKTEMSECLNKSEDKLNCLGDNLSNEFVQISHGTIEDDMGSIDLFNPIETNEKDATDQNIARSNETRDVGCEFEQMNQVKLMDESDSMVLYDDVNMGVKFEYIDDETKKESTFGFLPDVADMDDEKTFTLDVSEGKIVHTNLLSEQKLSASVKLFDSLDGKELELYTPDKENKNPNACSGKSLSKKAVKSVVYGEKDIFGFSQKLFATDEGMCIEQEKVDPFAYCEEVFAISSEKESKSIQMTMEGSSNSNNCSQTVQKAVNSSQNFAKYRWTMVVDTNSLLDPKSLKHLKLLEGIKGTQLFVPKNVVRELMDFKRNSKKVSLALKWIAECMINTRWWINMDDNEFVHSSKAVPEILAFTLHLREEITDQKIIILSDNLTLKIKAMAEGIMCEAAEEFYKSLVNPFSERFMWVGSSARGLTWSCVDDDHDTVRQKYHGSGLNGSHRFKGLKLLARVTTSQLV